VVVAAAVILTFNHLNQQKSPAENKSVNSISDNSEVAVGNLVGGDKDEHGCIGSAGYSWCEQKQKCLRIWEEVCDSTCCQDCHSWCSGCDHQHSR